MIDAEMDVPRVQVRMCDDGQGHEGWYVTGYEGWSEEDRLCCFYREKENGRFELCYEWRDGEGNFMGRQEGFGDIKKREGAAAMCYIRAGKDLAEMLIAFWRGKVDLGELFK